MIEDLLDRAKNGEEEALGIIYQHFFPKIFYFVSRKVQSHEVAEDITSDVFYRVIKNIKLFKANNELAFTKWIFMIARFTVANYYRFQVDLLSLDQLERYGVSDNISFRDNWIVAVQAINMLTEDQRQVLINHFIIGYSLAMVARLTGKRECAIKAMQHRALQNLRKMLI